MSRSKFGPAAGAPGGPAPRLTRMRAPEYLKQQRLELEAKWSTGNPIALMAYDFIVAGSDFKTGEFLGSYARLISLCTRPAPERGRPPKGPSYKQMRIAIDDLIAVGLVVRGEQNEAQGQLRLRLLMRGGRTTSTRKKGRV